MVMLYSTHQITWSNYALKRNVLWHISCELVQSQYGETWITISTGICDFVRTSKTSRRFSRILGIAITICNLA